MAAAGYWKMRRLWGRGWEDKISLTIFSLYLLRGFFLHYCHVVELLACKN